MSRDKINRLGEQVIGALIEVHPNLGPGLLESAYELTVCHELSLREIAFDQQLSAPITDKGIKLESGCRLDLLVAGSSVVEHKPVADLSPVFKAQIIAHLKLAKKPLGYLANFHAKQMKDGIRRFANSPRLTPP